MSNNVYRLVADYGHGDKTWLQRNLTAMQALRALNIEGQYHYETIEDALSCEGAYYLEEDFLDDVEDWDWRDS